MIVVRRDMMTEINMLLGILSYIFMFSIGVIVGEYGCK